MLNVDIKSIKKYIDLLNEVHTIINKKVTDDE